MFIVLTWGYDVMLAIQTNSTESRLKLTVHLYHKASAMLIPRKDESLSRVLMCGIRGWNVIFDLHIGDRRIRLLKHSSDTTTETNTPETL